MINQTDHPLFDHIESLRFNGADYKPERDNKRLAGQLLRIFNAMKSGNKFTLSELERITGDPQASISAQMRHLRKKRFGGHTLEKEYLGDGLYQYWLVVNTAGVTA